MITLDHKELDEQLEATAEDTAVPIDFVGDSLDETSMIQEPPAGIKTEVGGHPCVRPWRRTVQADIACFSEVKVNGSTEISDTASPATFRQQDMDPFGYRIPSDHLGMHVDFETEALFNQPLSHCEGSHQLKGILCACETRRSDRKSELVVCSKSYE